MKIGLGSYSLRWSIGFRDYVPAKPMSAMDCLEFAIAEGCEVVQFADNLPLDTLSPSEHEALARRARESGVALELGTQSFDAEQARAYLDIAERIGARILRVALDTQDAGLPVADLAAEFRALLPRAKEIGCRIAIENHFNFPSQRMVDLLNLVADDNLGVCLDVANSICAGEWPKETIAVLAPYTINLHLKDYRIVPDPAGVGFVVTGCPLGEGRTDTPAVFDALAGRLDDMSLLVEHWLPRTGTDEEIHAQEIAWTRKNLAEARRQWQARAA